MWGCGGACGSDSPNAATSIDDSTHLDIDIDRVGVDVVPDDSAGGCCSRSDLS